MNYVGPVNPRPIAWQKMVSKVLRVAGSQGNFSFFSPRRLEKIAREVEGRCKPEASLDFFHGFTPWILTKPPRPYLAWSDCTFRDYLNIYHRREQFRRRDLDRIEQAEAAWLNNARRILFTSEWAAARAVPDYGLDSSRVGCVGLFGEVEMPAVDVYDGGSQFAFVATDFEAKGGKTVLEALRQVRERHPDATLVVIGDRPNHPTTDSGVEFTGFLRKENPLEYARYRQIMGSARAIVHPTMSDIAPLLLIEAAYFGCPVISSRKFAIPDLVEDGRTGFLLDDSLKACAVADVMCRMLENEDEYRRMRAAAWTRSREQHSRQRFEERLLAAVRE